jgi:hypothetical protein
MADLTPLNVNRGGTLSPKEVVGRDTLLARLWRNLDRQSLLLDEARRMGKTAIILKMNAEPPAGWLPIYRDVEGVRTPQEFVETLLEDIEPLLTGKTKAKIKARAFLNGLAGAEVKGFKLPPAAQSHWKPLLNHLAEDLTDFQQQQGRRVVLLWDEIPWMLDSIRQTSGEAAAMELLDTLRALRQTHPALRMVFTGSVGLHHVLSSLKRSGYGNAPVNDMLSVDVPPLTPEDAENLAGRLLIGENLPAKNRVEAAAQIARAVDNVPFYVHHVVGVLSDTGWEATEANIARAVSRLLTDPNDPLGLRHYRDRITKHYLEDQRPFALGILDALATASESLSFDNLFNQLKAKHPTEDAETTRDVLTLLRSDHYLDQTDEGTYRFRYAFIARSWRLQRGLGA